MTAGADTATPESNAEVLHRVWDSQPGFVGWLGQCNHKAIGRRFIFTAFFFLLAGGALAMLMRTQLAVPNNEVIGPDGFNQLFTMHGTIMMFLFVVPILEGFTIYVAPMALGARDMPMPRVNAFGYWCFLLGGAFLLSSFVVGAAPDSGWFAYVPLTGPEFAPGLNLDFWLLGVTLLEISGVVAAIEVVVMVLRFRTSGMSLTRVPVFVWAGFVTSVMMLFAFPPLIAGTVLLELDRKIGTVFYDAGAGGDPLLWQHLFWWFGHPEVYIQLLPAVGIAASILTACAGRRIAGRTAVIASLVAIGVLSFGLWVHHMYATGIPLLATSLFTAASFMIAIPSGVIVMAFIATMWWGKIRWTSAMLYVGAFVFVFVAGGITGVMVAMVPLDWQVHDTYFVVAHFHYVLVGGSLFPILGGIHHWLPKVTGRMMDERLGRIAFGCNLLGFNLAFFPQHVLGLWGMPRRVWTYQEGLGWDGLNLISTVGSYLMGVGMLVFTLNLVLAHRRSQPTAPANPWGGESLEWATPSPVPPYNFASLVHVTSPEPMWDAPSATRAAGARPPSDPPAWQRRLDRPDHGLRELLATTGMDARPDHLVVVPGHSLWPLWAAISFAVGLLGVLIDGFALGMVGLTGLVISVVVWLWPGGQT